MGALLFSGEFLDLRIAQAVFLLVVFAVLVEADELPLSGRVVHQRDKAHKRIVDMPVEQLHHAIEAQLTAQMQHVLRAKDALQLTLADCRGHGVQLPHPIAGPEQIAKTDGVEDSGNAGGRQLGIMRHRGGNRRPIDPRARRKMFFQIIGMKLDKSRQDVIAVAVDHRHGVANDRIDGDDAALFDQEGGVDDLVLENEPGIGQQEVIGHAACILIGML